MGSTLFYTYAEAANRLGKSKRSIHNYVKRGYIKSQTKDGNTVLSRHDVEQLAIELGSDLPAMNRKTFFQLQSRLQKLEEEMKTVKHILEIRDEPLRPSDVELQTLYGAAQSYLAAGKWEKDTIDSWAGLFERMDEGFLEKLIKTTQEPKAWVPIFDLCLRMHDFAHSQTQESLEWQVRYQKLDEGRKKLRGTIIMWTEMGRGTTPYPLLSSLEDPKEGLLRKLAAS